MLLDPADLEALTGYKRASCQARWLRERGWLFEIGGDGKPKVLRAHAMQRLGGVESDEPKPEPQLRFS